MQYKNSKSLHLINVIGKVVKELRQANSKSSLNIFAYEYELTPGNLCRIENGKIEPKITMLWRIAEALGIPLSELIRRVENEVGSDFSIIDK